MFRCWSVKRYPSPEPFSVSSVLIMVSVTKRGEGQTIWLHTRSRANLVTHKMPLTMVGHGLQLFGSPCTVVPEDITSTAARILANPIVVRAIFDAVWCDTAGQEQHRM